ncbi:hypothetical protein ASPBRDRAFT_194062 [Aspergillus brasiliensis CBS 101740]|uniref:Uncharacterized protein n=1 Tax=Aspergillus brasiliensis (strain CBS 101740 / IMI 381727 / IBT 21946) TaxID=767769 RepID=A0A1L9UN08_ASPBC|nr:hypothetical protein ASPBRDRAFT_194062 [Aspergillus brasiliensis CBS 101740]
MEDLATKRHLDEDFEQTGMSSTYARYSAKKMGNSAGDIATQGRSCFLDDEAPVIADTPKKSSDNTSEVHENMTAEVPRETPAPAKSVLLQTYHKSLAILSRIGLIEGDTRPGHTRIRWKNGRGKWLYDDYVEHVPGALEDMKGFLNHHVPASSTPPDNSTVHESQTQYSTSSDTVDQLQNSNVFPTNDSQTDVELGERIAHPPVLLSCLKNGTYAVELRQESIIGIADDRQLFHRLRRIYHDHRGRLRPIWSLKTLHSIRFMKFAYGGARYIDVRCHEEICEPGRPCLCVPPEHLVLPKGKEYDCHPIPPRLSPPIGPQLMMDFFMHPEYISPNSTFIIQQLPKRACGKLHGEYRSLTEAWGIYYKEDWNWAKIWWILAFGFFPPGLLFGVLWAVYKQDISGGFGVASWWMAGASIIVGILSTYDM